MLKQALCTVGLAVCSISSSVSLAKNLTLYDQPNDTAKVVGTIDTEVGFVPIFTQKDGKWAKVGDPQNGNTGWVKSSELSDAAGTSHGFSYSQTMTRNEKGVPSMVVRFGQPKRMTDKEMQDFFIKTRQQQEAVQRDVQNIMQNFFNNQPDWVSWPYPMVLPVMVVPVQSDQPVPVKATPNTKQKSAG